MKPDYFLVLPWHFKENILQREQEFMALMKRSSVCLSRLACNRCR